jgi:hypothetical protein
MKIYKGLIAIWRWDHPVKQMGSGGAKLARMSRMINKDNIGEVVYKQTDGRRMLVVHHHYSAP